MTAAFSEIRGNSDQVLILDNRPLRRLFVASFVERELGRTAAAHARCADVDQEVSDFALCVLIIGADTLCQCDRTASRLAEAVAFGAPVIVLADREAPAEVQQAMAMGAAGYLTLDMTPAIFLAALNLVEAGGSFAPADAMMKGALTAEGEDAEFLIERARADSPLLDLSPRQREVLRLVSQGKLNKEIAHRLGMTEGTVKSHVRNILRKLDVGNRTQAAHLFLQGRDGIGL